ncbi:MAG: PQQ-binding-like beta-propeller repeat protein [Candidatus Bathyarchaeia archaeon]
MSKLKQALTIAVVLLVLVQSALFASAQPDVSTSPNEWPMFRQNPAHTAFHGDKDAPDLPMLLWRYPTNRAIHSSPTVADGRLFVGSRDSQVYCINVSTGMPIWRRAFGCEVWSSPAIDTEQVIVGMDNGFVYSLNITSGDIVWKTPIGEGAVRSSPTLDNGKVFIGSGSSGLYCLNATNGEVIWVAPTKLRVNSSPAVSGGVVYFACDDYATHAVNASDGSELWQTHTGSIQSSPSIQVGRVYVGSVDGFVYCLNAADGTIIWQYQTDGQVDSSPAVAYGHVYVGSCSGNLYCLDSGNGELAWQAPTSYWITSSPAVADGNVYVGSQDQNIYCFNAYTGEQKWSYETGNLIESSPAVVNNTVYVCSYDFMIYAFALTDKQVENPVYPFESNISLNIATFDAVAVATILAVISGFVLIVHKNRQKKANQTPAVDNGKSWLRNHADTAAVLTILAFSVAFFVLLENGPLWLADEQTYSQWAFHMNKSGDYLTPWSSGAVNFWISKPPLYMWLMALSYQLFGFSNFATRLISPFFGFLAMTTVYFLGKTLYSKKTGFAASIILGTFVTFFLFSRHAMTDVMFVFFITAGIYFILVSEKTEKANWYAALAGAFFGLALMTKQVQAFLLPLIVIIYFLIAKRSLRFLFTKRFAAFLGVGLLIFLPWVTYMLMQYGSSFSEWYFIYSGITRATNPIEGHDGGIFYYLTYLVTAENPVWIAALPFAVGFSAYAVTKRSKPDMLLIVWITIVLGLFTFAQTKLYWYILPAFPAFALAIANMLMQLSEKYRKKKTQKQAINPV